MTTKKQNEIIYKALVEYEEAHYLSEGRAWQRSINALIDKYKKYKTNDDDDE